MLILVGNKKELLNVDSTAYPKIGRMFQLLDEGHVVFHSMPPQEKEA